MSGIELPVDPEHGIRVGRPRTAEDGPTRDLSVDFPVSTGADAKRLLELVCALLERNQQLEYALSSRVAIEQAKGILAERLRLSPDEAFEVLRRAARSNRTRIHDLAQRVIESPTTPPEIEAVQMP